jgi:hypothetical protein
MSEKYHKEVSVKKFLNEYFSKTYIDKSYQRFEVWSEGNKYSFLKSVYKGLVANPIIVVSVGLCKEHARMTGNKEDLEYFQSIENMGCEYISVDGNNRSQTINSYYNKELEKSLYNDDDRDVFEDTELYVVIFGKLSKNDIHDLAINTNKGDSWNDQESRNAMNTQISGFIRDTRTDFWSILTNKIKITKLNRMKGDELLVKMLAYENYGEIKLNQKQLNKVYTDKNLDVSKFKRNIKTLKKIMSYHTADVKLHNSEFFNLYVLISYLNKNNMKINDLGEFYLDFHEKQNLRRSSTDTYESENGKIVTWSGLNGNLGLDYQIKMEVMLHDLDLDKHFTVKDDKRAFSLKQKIQIWERDWGMVRVNNHDKPIKGSVYEPYNKNSFIKVTLMEALTSEYVVDHIVPHTEGGQTVVENGQITTKGYNLWKNKNMYESV